MSGDPSGALAVRLLEASELHGDFVLSSGQRSDVYFDKFRFLGDPTLLHDVATRVAELLPEDVTHLASPEGAATLLLAATALAARLPLAVVRREAKSYGTRATVEGYAPAGARVALLEDVATTGAQVLAAARQLDASGAGVAVIILAIDRGGGRRLREAGYEVRAVVSIDGRQ